MPPSPTVTADWTDGLTAGLTDLRPVRHEGSTSEMEGGRVRRPRTQTVRFSTLVHPPRRWTHERERVSLWVALVATGRWI